MVLNDRQLSIVVSDWGSYLGSLFCHLSPGSAVTGRDREVRGATHNWPSVVRVREGLPVGKSLSHRAPATPVAGRAQCALAKVARWASDTLVRLASGLDERCVKKQYGWLGCVSEDA